MLSKSKFVTSTLLSLLLLTSNLSSQEVDCKNGQCHVNVASFPSSKNMPKRINTFKKIHSISFLTPLENEDLRITHPKVYVETIILSPSTYIKKNNEKLIAESDIEKNTLILAPHKYVMSIEEREKYNEQQNKLAKTKLAMEPKELELKIIEPSLPIPLYYCKNNTEPIYDEKLEQFQCLI